jgi:hypothetical protein
MENIKWCYEMSVHSHKSSQTPKREDCLCLPSLTTNCVQDCWVSPKSGTREIVQMCYADELEIYRFLKLADKMDGRADIPQDGWFLKVSPHSLPPSSPRSPKYVRFLIAGCSLRGATQVYDVRTRSSVKLGRQ